MPTTVKLPEEAPASAMDISKTSDDCFFGGNADICKEFNCCRSRLGSENLDPVDDIPQNELIEEIGGTKEKNSTPDKEMALIESRSFVVSPEVYRTLIDNLYTARLAFLRARNITVSQIDAYKEEAIEHMREIARLVHRELENPELDASIVAEDLVKTGKEVFKNQLDLNIIEVKELEKNLENLLDTLRSAVQKAKSETPSTYESEERSKMELIFDYGHWCLFVLCVFIVLVLGVSQYLPLNEQEL